MNSYVNPDDPKTWSHFSRSLIAHDIARSRDRSTAMIGGYAPYPFRPNLFGVGDFEQLPQGLIGYDRARALAQFDGRYDRKSLIIADITNDDTYGEVLLEGFGTRAVGLHIGRFGDGMEVTKRQCRAGHLPVFNVGRTHLIEFLHRELNCGRVGFKDAQAIQLVYGELANLVVEHRETGTVYTCPPGLHDDLAITLAMLVWFSRHPMLDAFFERQQPPPAPRQPPFTKAAWT